MSFKAVVDNMAEAPVLRGAIQAGHKAVAELEKKSKEDVQKGEKDLIELIAKTDQLTKVLFHLILAAMKKLELTVESAPAYFAKHQKELHAIATAEAQLGSDEVREAEQLRTEVAKIMKAVHN